MKKTTAIILAVLLFATMSVTVFAANVFTPSVTAKGAPEVKTVIGSDGQDLKDSVTQISLADAKKYETSEEIKNLIAAGKELKDISKIDSLVEGIQKANKDIKIEDLVVSDVFNVFMIKNKDYLNTKGNTIEITFAVKAREKPIVMLRDNDGNWSVIDPKFVIVNKDGSVTVTLDKVGVIAFANIDNSKEAKKLPVKP